MYQYNATIVRVIDGDTCEINIDLGMKIFYRNSCRLAGINAPELNSPDEATRQAAIASKEFLVSTLPPGIKAVIDSKSLDKYGRPIVVIWLGVVNVNDLMISTGNAVVYK